MNASQSQATIGPGSRFLVSIRYTRRGLTNLWDYDDPQLRKLPPHSPLMPRETPIVQREGKYLWVDIVTKADNDLMSDDVIAKDDVIVEAEKLAHAVFRKLIPEAYLL